MKKSDNYDYLDDQAEMQQALHGKLSTFEDQDAELRPVWRRAGYVLLALALAFVAWKGFRP